MSDAELPEPSPWLVREWAVYGIVAAAARFVPVPLLDDVVRERATRIAMVRTLRSHDRDVDADVVEPMYAGVEGALAGVGKYLRSVPRRILLFPVRKYVAVFGSVKGVPTDVMTVLLLARSLHRELARGHLAGDPESARKEAFALRTAFDATLAEMDLDLLVGAVGDALSKGKNLSQVAVARARELVRRARDGEAEPKDEPDDEVTEAAGGVAGLMDRKDVATLVAEFDARLDARLSRPGPAGR